MTGLTLTEKIVGQHLASGPLSDAALPPPPRQGDFVLVHPRRVLTHDNTAAVIPKFNALFAGTPARTPAIFDNSQPVLALDHDIQNLTSDNLARYATIERFARTHNLPFHRAGSGIGHQIMLDGGHVLPGTLVVASDSHANAYGALGALGLPVVRTDAAVIWATGSTWWHIPPVVRIDLRGTLAPGVTGKDVIIALCARFPTDAQNAAVEFVGPGLRSLSISDRIAIANMTTEWGAIACVMEPDDAVDAYLATRLDPASMARASHTHLAPDPDAHYARTLSLDLSTVEASIAGPNRTDLATPASVLAAQRIRIDVAYLLSCVNARLPDLQQAADVVRGRRIHPLVTFYIAAASASIQREAEARGIWRTLLDAGATPLPSGCGPCIGLGSGTLKSGQTAISATNRNFPGRMGDRSAQVYLANPAIVAASAIAGYITTPALLAEEEMRGNRQWAMGNGTEEPSTGRKCDVLSPPQPDEVGAERDRGGGVAMDAQTNAAGGDQARSSPIAHCPFPIAPTSPRAILLPEPDVSTDGIYAGRHTYRNDMTPSDMASVIFENLDPVGSLPITPHIRAGDIILAGRNFGRGSSREQAATALKHAGIAAVIAVSLNATYLRNAINNGLLALECPDLARVIPQLTSRPDAPHPRLGPPITLDLESSTLTLHSPARDTSTAPITLALRPLAPFMRALLNSGGVEPWARAMLHQSRNATFPTISPSHSPSTLHPQSTLLPT